MAKFIVTVVVETDKVEKPPTKKVIKALMHEMIGIVGAPNLSAAQQTEMSNLFAEATLRVRSIDID